MISYLLNIVNSTSQYYPSTNIIREDITSLAIANGPENYPVDLDLNLAQNDIQKWLYNSISSFDIYINQAELREFLHVFLSTFGIIRLRDAGITRYLFVYISNGLEPYEIGFLKKLF